MALTTYAGLKGAIGSRLNRADQAGFAADYVTLAETAMNRRLRVPDMVGRGTAIISAGYAAVPSDFLGAVSMEVDGRRLSFLTPDEADAAAAGLTAGPIAYYSLVGSEFRFLPAPAADGAATLTYWRAIPALSDAAPANWLLARHPDAYLYGGLLQAALQIRDDALVATYGQLFETAMADIASAGRLDAEAAPTPLPNGYAW